MSNQVNETMVKEVLYEAHYVTLHTYSSRDGFESEKRETMHVPAEFAKIIFNGNRVIVILDGGYRGVAKCDPGDTFNPRVGVKIAYDRAKIKKLRGELRERGYHA